MEAISCPLDILTCFFMTIDVKQIYSDWSGREYWVFIHIISLLHRCLEEEKWFIHEEWLSFKSTPHRDFPVPLLVQPTHHFASLWGNIRCIILLSYLLWLKWYSALQMLMQQRAKERETKGEQFCIRDTESSIHWKRPSDFHVQPCYLF